MEINIAKKLPVFNHGFAIHFISFLLLRLLLMFAKGLFQT